MTLIHKAFLLDLHLAQEYALDWGVTFFSRVRECGFVIINEECSRIMRFQIQTPMKQQMGALKYVTQ